MITTTYLGSGVAGRQRRDYRLQWLDNLADDVTTEGSVLTGIPEGPEAIRAVLGFARTLHDYQEFNFVGPFRDHGFVEDYTSMVPVNRSTARKLARSLPRQRCLCKTPTSSAAGIAVAPGQT